MYMFRALNKDWNAFWSRMDADQKESLQHLIIEAIIEQDAMADANIPDDFLGKKLNVR
jgi:hypothetical protein